MNPLRPVRALYRFALRRHSVEREMHEEMDAHLDRAVARLERRGLSTDEARRAALREFGNVAYLQEEARDARGGQHLETLARDIKFAFRHFARTPLTAITLVLVLSVGIGVNAALFSMLQTLTTRYAPAVPADDALVRIRGTVLSRTEGSLDGRGLSMLEIMDLSARTATFSAVAGYAQEGMVLDLGDGSDPRVLRGHYVTPNYFATIGVRPILGAGLPAGRIGDTPGAELAVVIGHQLWGQLGGDSSVVGRTVRLNDVPVRIVGVAPPRFEGPVMDPGTVSLWALIAARPALTKGTTHALASRDSTLFEAVARLAPNATVEEATALARVVATTLGPVPKPDERVEYSSDVVPARGFTNVMDPGSGTATIVLNATGGILILLVVCTNVSALLVGAAVARRREIAIRLSLGASRWRVIRQMLTESSLIALAGGALGVTLYWWIIKLVVWFIGDVPFGPDLGTVGFTALIALGTGILFGLSPAVHSTRLDVASALKSSGGGTSSRSRLQRTFIVAQIVLTQPLLVGIAMMIGGILDQTGSQAGSTLEDRVVFVQLGVSAGAGPREDRARRVAGFMERVASLPGVESVIAEPSTIDIADWRVHPGDRGSGPRAQESVRAAFDGAPPGYFAFQNIPIQRGRDLVAADTVGSDVMPVVVESGFARGFWGADDPIGKRLELTSVLFKQEGRPMVVPAVVVGVFDTTGTPLRGTGRVYTAGGSRWRDDAHLVRTRGHAAALVPTIRQLARAELPDIPPSGNGIATLAELDRIERREAMQIGAGATAAGLIALLLASIGLYGVVALAVRQRHREIGVRVALGARPRQVTRMFFLSGIRLSIIGIVLGIPLSVAAVWFISSEFGDAIPPLSKPIVGAGIATAVIVVAAVASWVPARRAAVVDPLVAIRAV